MNEETAGLPSAADLDAVNAELEAANANLPQPPSPVPEAEQNQGQAVAPDPMIVSRHGEIFDKSIHARNPDGTPKTDSTGRFILKEHDYCGPRPSAQFPQ